MAYKPVRATFDSVAVGDKIKRNGMTYIVRSKTARTIEIHCVADVMYDFSSSRTQQWTKREFNSRKYNRVCEPPIKKYRIEDLREC